MQVGERGHIWLRIGGAAAIAVLLAWAVPGLAAETEFPYEGELLLEAPPMKGSKRVPIITVDPGGEAAIDLWCASMQAQFVIAGDTLTILPGEKSGPACDPERMRADDDLASALQQVTGWRRLDDVLVLNGPQVLRFRLSTH
jgi:heat shock protein HslJ